MKFSSKQVASKCNSLDNDLDMKIFSENFYGTKKEGIQKHLSILSQYPGLNNNLFLICAVAK